MLTLSATCLAIATAAKSGTLRLEARRNERLEKMGLSGSFVAICDGKGLIEVATSMAEAERRILPLRKLAA